jgi:hypothetical protein
MNMLNARKKLATLAVASAISGGAMMVSAPAQALNVSQNGLGEVLLFPYYTVKNGFDTVFTVTNTTNMTATFKIRFREALNSREVRDFNVVLSPYDHWSGAVTAKNDGAVVRTYDNTCTSPDKPDWTSVGGSGYEIDFTNYLYSGNFKDGAVETMDRLLEGYFEVILMGVSTRSTSVSTNVVEYNAKHVGGSSTVAGVPRNCAIVDAAFDSAATIADPVNGFGAFTAPQDILKGHVTYINVANGTAYDGEPVSVEAFQNTNNIIYEPSNLLPDLTSGDATTVATMAAGAVIGPLLVDTPIGDGAAASSLSVNAVSMALMSTGVINEFASGTGAATSWVITFPTKHYYTDALVDPAIGPTLEDGDANAPFSEWFYNGAGDGKSCEPLSLANLFDREELTSTAPPGRRRFSPVEYSTPTGVNLCYEVNVVDFNSSSIFGAGTNHLGVDTTDIGTSGWMELSFIGTAATTVGLTGTDASAVTHTFVGLPVTGFAAMMRDRGSAVANYGSSTLHSYRSGAR